jgi:selenocysteine lyase/cysteine desulfurase
MPAHKGLYAPQGLGIMMLGDNVRLDTLIEGGNGVNSLDEDMGMTSPERYEGGTLCTPAIAGLCAGLEFLTDIGYEHITTHERALWARAYEQLSSMSGVTVYDAEHSGAVLLWNVEGLDADAVGTQLSKQGFCLRTGYHCAPLAHKSLRTASGGALRMSFSLFNTPDEVDLHCQAVREIVG